MANPKRRHSKARTGKRRSTWRLNVPNYGPCPQCHKPKPPHRACPECGYYDGRQVIAVETDKE
ncbi:MAG: 50S ribosomal protein L32 [Firmicutes bacterium]|nr:50S ribosomal protein L32 [Bacillota bacterium]